LTTIFSIFQLQNLGWEGDCDKGIRFNLAIVAHILQ
jgi:hypothetical protein